MNNICKYIFIGAMTFMAVACGSKQESGVAEVEVTEIDAVDYVKGHAVENSGRIDTLALNADELSASDGVGVLLAYVEIENDAVARRKSKTMTETMRKFVDVYDILLSNHGQEFRKAMEQARTSAGVDLVALAGEYRNYLADYDSGSGVEGFGEVKKDDEKADSAAVASDNVIPEQSQAEPVAEPSMELD